MADKVVDASAVAALLFNEPKGTTILERVHGHSLWAPTLLSYELTNIAWKKLTRAPEDESLLLEALRRRAVLNIAERPVDPEGVFELARRTRLTAYDASYLWLSRLMSVELITLDEELVRAAEVA